MGFVHLHCHDSYSLLDGAMSTEAMVKRAKELGQIAIAQTNHGNLFGTHYFYEECKKAGVKPIIGMEAYIAPKERQLRDEVEGEPPSYHLVLLAKNNTGLKNLFKLSTLAWHEGFYYKPRIDKEILTKYHEGLICTSACIRGKLATLALHACLASDPAEDLARYNQAKQEAQWFKDLFGEDFYIEIQRPGMPEQEAILRPLATICSELGISAVATCDAHYLTREDAAFHDQILCIQTGSTLQDEKRLKQPTDQLYLKSTEEMEKLFHDWPTAIGNTEIVAAKCDVTIESSGYIFPAYPDTDGLDEETNLRLRANLGLTKLHQNKLIPEELYQQYQDRLKTELDAISKMGFPGYFLVVADYVNWARGAGIAVGPGRGSAAGSLVAWCTGITSVDPIKYGLIFERFLNPGRLSLPDIDSDFCMNRRHEVIGYLAEKYGADKVAQISTFGTFKPRSSVRDFARAQGHPFTVGDELAKKIPDNIRGHPPTWDRVCKEIPEVEEGDFSKITAMAKRSDGMVRHSGVHASGVVISPLPLVEIVPLFRGKDDVLLTQWDMDIIEKIGLVKVDILGITALTTIDTCLGFVKRTTGKVIDIEAVPDNEEAPFDTICKGDVSGIFQFEGSAGIRDLAVKLQPRTIDELAVISALFRPGPLDSGMADTYVRRKRQLEAVSYSIPQLAPILKDTQGLMIYQEQAMRIARDLAGYTLEQADDLRKAIGKKLPEKMALEEKRLIGGMVKNGISKADATEIWESIKKFADYSFNKAHAVAYSVTTYRMAWLKAHYPTEFYCALLTMHVAEKDKTLGYLADCKRADIQVLPPDINESAAGYIVVKGVIRFGLTGIKDIGAKMADTIISAKGSKPFENIVNFYERTQKLGVTKRTLEALVRAGCFDSSGYTRAANLAIIPDLVAYPKKVDSYNKKMATYQKKLQQCKDRSDDIAALVAAGQKPKAPLTPPTLPLLPKLPAPDKDLKELSPTELMAMEKDAVGLYISSHPLYAYAKEIMKKTTAHSASLIDHRDREEVLVIGIISNLVRRTTKSGNKMATFDLEDLHGYVPVTVFHRTLEECSSSIAEGSIVLMRGKVEAHEDTGRKLIAQELVKLPPKDVQQAPKIAEIVIKNPDLSLVEKLKTIASTHPGDERVQVKLVFEGQSLALVSPLSLSPEGWDAVRLVSVKK